MRHSLFLSTLFVISSIGTAALAESAPAIPKEARPIDRLRAHGDVVDKVYYSATRGEHAGRPGAARPAPAAPAPSRGSAPVDKGANRVNCSDSGVDCVVAKGKTSTVAEASQGQTGRAARAPAFLDKILGSDRTNFNEAGEDNGMSRNAVKRAWSSSSGGATQSKVTDVAVLGMQRQVDRKSQQAASERMSCNDADECSMSTKDQRRVWARASIDAGTWSGPAKAPVSNAERRIAAQRAAEGAGAAKADREKAGDAGHPADQHQAADHQH